MARDENPLVPDLLKRVTETLGRIDAHLDQLAEALKGAQPKLPGAITFERHNCGSHCLGCPHPRWKIWRQDKRFSPVRWYASTLTANPSLSLKKKGQFLAGHELARNVVQEIQDTLKARTALVDALSKVGKVLTGRRIG